MEYARSLIKQRTTDEFAEDDIVEESTLRNPEALSPSSFGSVGSPPKAPSEDWSVISDQDEGCSLGSSQNRKRKSLTAAVLSAQESSVTDSVEG